jgi:hypothetical protein
MLRIAYPCGCRQESYMGQKRERLCEHRNVFERPDAQGKTSPRRRSAPLKPGKGFAASKQQRQKVRGLVCVGCGREASEDGSVVIDPAHVWPKGKGGCDKAACVLPMCRFVFDGSGCHKLFDEGKLDLLARLEERDTHEAYAEELAHPIAEHGVSLVSLVRRLTGSDWEFTRKSTTEEAAQAAPKGAVR